MRGLALRIISSHHSDMFQQSWTASGRLLFLIAVSGLGAIGLVILSALWAGTESDSAALDRQRQLVNARLQEQVDQVARAIDQLGSGYVVRQADADALSRTAISAFGYDQAFIVDDKAELITQVNADAAKRYRWMRPLLLPILKDVIQTQNDTLQSSAKRTASAAARKTPPHGALARLMRLEGRPTIAGVAAISKASDTGTDQSPSFLIAVRFIDGAALDDLSREQGLNGARFARTADPDANEVAFQIDATVNGEPIGFIVWRPDLPGSRVIGRLMPALSIAAFVIAALFSVLLVRLRQSLGELKRSEFHARQLALHDVLTGLPNRALFAVRFEECLADTVRANQRSAIALLDLDRFKAVNDTFGHAAGDELIKAAVDRMRSVLRPGDTLARLGGDEFALLLLNIGEDDFGLAQVCTAIIGELGEPFELLDGKAVARVGVSIGVTTMPDRGLNGDDLMRYADVALYEVKMAGRGQWQLFTSAMAGGQSERQIIKNELREVLTRGAASKGPGGGADPAGPTNFGHLELYYQTIHRPQKGFEVAGVEALVRWHHSQRGLLSPSTFIPAAEEGGLIDALGLWVLRDACRAACDWPDDTFVAVNVAPSQLRRPDFAANVLAALHDSGLPPRRLELELTESSLVDDCAEVDATLKSLRKLGIQISLDDFGTGYSSLGYLLRFEIDRIKIDRSFVALLGSKASGAAIVNAIAMLCRSLGIAVTAEGVETDYQRDFLDALGCDLQGYIFSKPVPLKELTVFFDNTVANDPDHVDRIAAEI